MRATTFSPLRSLCSASAQSRSGRAKSAGYRCSALFLTAVLGLLSSEARAQFAVQPLQPSPPPPVVPGGPPPAEAAPAKPPAAKKAAPKDDSKDGAKDTVGKDAPKDGSKAAKDPSKEGSKAAPKDGAKGALSDADKPGSKLPKAALPKAVPAVKMGPPLSKAEVFGRAAPATLILIAAQENRWRSTLGVVVSPQGIVVTDSRLLAGIEKGAINGFMYDPSLASDDDPMMFLRAHKEQAIKLNVVRVDTEHHLLMLQLPVLPPKKNYTYLDLNDTQGVNPGLDIVALRTRGAQTLAMASGSIDIKRPDLIEIQPGLTVESAGAPLLSLSGRLLGICIYADKALHASGAVRPVEIVRDLLAGRIGGDLAAQTVPSAPESPTEARNAVEAVRIGLGTAFSQRYDKQPALRLHSEFVSAMALRGRAVVHGLDSADALNGIIKAITKGSDAKGRAVVELFPMLVTEKGGAVWMKAGNSYRMVPASGNGVAAIDDQTGTLYATDTRREVMMYDETSAGKSWRMTGLTQVSQLRAGGGQLYVILLDGRVLVAERDGKNSRQLFPRAVKAPATLELSQGVLYVISEGSVYRYRNKKWDAKLQPIAFSIAKLIVRGENWYGLDAAGRVFSSTSQHYIDRDGNIVDLWGLGPNLMVLTRDNNRFFYSAIDDSWGAWTRW